MSAWRLHTQYGISFYGEAWNDEIPDHDGTLEEVEVVSAEELRPGDQFYGEATNIEFLTVLQPAKPVFKLRKHDTVGPTAVVLEIMKGLDISTAMWVSTDKINKFARRPSPAGPQP